MSSYKVIKLAEKYSEKYNLSDKERDLLERIDNSAYHMIDVKNITIDNAPTITNLLDKRMIRHVKSHGKLPEGYAITTTGSYALGTFDYSDMY